jgi:hypothetical protein
MTATALFVGLSCAFILVCVVYSLVKWLKLK